MILPGVTPEAARERAEFIRMALSRLRISLEGGAIGEVTVSIGVSQYTTGLATGDAPVAAADRALYAAKKPDGTASRSITTERARSRRPPALDFRSREIPPLKTSA